MQKITTINIDEVKNILIKYSGNKVLPMKYVMDKTGCGLKEAKDYVENVLAKMDKALFI